MAQVQQRPAERPRGLTTRHAPGMQLTRVQQYGVVHMLRKFRDRDPPLNGMVLADVMGLGKSAQAIVLAAELGGRVLVVVPANHVPKWAFEIRQWAYGVTLVVAGRRASVCEAVQCFQGDERAWLLISYESAVERADCIIGWVDDNRAPLAPYISTFICDEAQTLENGTPRRETLMVVPARRVLLLTGTPLQNNLNDLYMLLEFACRGRFPGGWNEDVVDPIQRALSPQADETCLARGREAAALVRKILATYMIRRVHDATRMPPLHSYVVRCSPSKAQLEVADSLTKGVSGAGNGWLPSLHRHLLNAVHPSLLGTCSDFWTR